MDTVGGEMQKCIDVIKKDAVRIGSKKLVEHICELEYYVLALSKGISFEEDSGVATHFMETENKDTVEKWGKDAKNLITKVSIVNNKRKQAMLRFYANSGVKI